jgi:3-methyl-2-oxobutanoate hydroxymethyltransferase
MGHVGFTPQSEHGLGGHLVQGRGTQADSVLADAIAVQEAGAFAVVLELMPAELAKRITNELTIPTISVGAGPYCDGQLLVWTDFAGMSDERVPRFVKQYAHLAQTLRTAAQAFRDDVRDGNYPGPEHSFSDES